MSKPWTSTSEATWRKGKRRIAVDDEPRCTVAGCVQLAINDGRCYRHVFEDCERCGRERLDMNPPCDNYDNGPRRHKWVKRLGAAHA